MIDIPEPLKWVGTYLFIGDFPEANEDLLNQMAATYDQVAADIQRLANEVIADARALDNVLHGQAADAIIAVLHNIAHGHDTGLTDLAAQLDKAGTLLDVTALQVIAAKLYYIYALVEAAITIALAIAAAVETLSASLAAIPVTVAITRTVITQIIKQLVREIIENLARNAVKRIALNAAEGAGEAIVLETARQVVEKTIGFRENYDLNQIIEQALAGAKDGAIEGTIHDTAHHLGHRRSGDGTGTTGDHSGVAPTAPSSGNRRDGRPTSTADASLTGASNQSGRSNSRADSAGTAAGHRSSLQTENTSPPSANEATATARRDAEPVSAVPHHASVHSESASGSRPDSDTRHADQAHAESEPSIGGTSPTLMGSEHELSTATPGRGSSAPIGHTDVGARDASFRTRSSASPTSVGAAPRERGHERGASDSGQPAQRTSSPSDRTGPLNLDLSTKPVSTPPGKTAETDSSRAPVNKHVSDARDRGSIGDDEYESITGDEASSDGPRAEPSPLDDWVYRDPKSWPFAADEHPLTHRDAANIVAVHPPDRPAPSTYLPTEYIAEVHREFAGGATKFIPKWAYDKYGPLRDDGTTFVIPTRHVDAVIAATGGDARAVERALGLEPGLFDSPVVRLDVPDPERLGLTVPTGNEGGANQWWLPGAKLPQGMYEGVIKGVLDRNDEYILPEHSYTLSSETRIKSATEK